jgi:hypothetical protein
MFSTHLSFFKRLPVALTVIAAAALLASCGLPGPTIASPTPLGPTPLPPLTATPTTGPIVVTSQPTDTVAVVPADTAVIAPSATPQPTFTQTPTLQPAATSASAAGSISFTPGTTAGVVQGTVQPGQVLTYTLGASQGQTMVLILESLHSDVSLGVYDPGGAMLLNPAFKWNRWQTLLPKTGLNTIQVIGGGSAENFTLTVKVAQVVNFAPGTSSIVLNGTTVNGYLYSYSLSATAGQTMTVSLNVPNTTAYIDIYGISTGTLLNASSKATSWTGVLPQTQVYVIEVIPTGGAVVNYALTVAIPSSGGTVVTPVPANGEIVFQAGTTAGTVSGTIQAGQTITYKINASAGRPIILDVSSINADVTLGVIQPDGGVLLNPANKWTHWQWMLPLNGVYRIQLIGGATAENYSLTATIPVVVNFAAGTSSTVLNGSTVNGQTFSYALNAAANQTMTVNLNAAAGSAKLAIFGLTSGTLLSPSSNATSWTVVLPNSEFYVVQVIPNASAVVNYALSVAITSPLSTPATTIAFTPGTTAAVVQGTVQAGQVLSYTLAASQWQPMIVSLESPAFDAYLGIYEQNGAAVVSPGNRWVHWTGLLPQTETYTIQVNGVTAANYTLTVKIAQRITFQLGQSKVTLNGTNVNGYVFSYAFKANAGQTMTVTLNQPTDVAYIDVFGIATGSLLSPSEKANTWTGVLPQYQDYIVEVIPRHGQLMSYTLVVEIH